MNYFIICSVIASRFRRSNPLIVFWIASGFALAMT